MKFLFLIIFILAGCELHKSESTVSEVQVFKGEELSLGEDIHKAYLENNKEALLKFFEEGFDINEPILAGKNLIFLAVEDENLSKAYFLMKYNADPTLVLNILSNDENAIELETTALKQADLITDENSKKLFLDLLNNDLKSVSNFLFFDLLNNTKKGESFDIPLIEEFFDNVSFDHLDQKMFKRLIVKNVSELTNSDELYRMIFGKVTLDQQAQWILWIEDNFTKGRYKRAKCKFESMCLNFDDFVKTCKKRMRKRLKKYKINPLLTVRNKLNKCDG